MKTLLALVSLLALSTAAEARDSTWLVCQNSKLLLNVHEHRASMDSRESSLTLIYGAHVLEGSLVDTDDGVVGLTTRSVRDTTYSGRIAIDFGKKVARVAGDLTLNGYKLAINERLGCKQLTEEL